jgi:hypothetical protein
MSCNVKFEGAGNPRNVVRLPLEEIDLCLLQSVQTGSGTHPVLIRLLPKDFSPGRESDHSFHSNGGIKKDWRYVGCPMWLNGVKKGYTLPLLPILWTFIRNWKQAG